MTRTVDVVIVGSGFAGIGMGIRLLQSGRGDFVILEKAADLGGTWRDNSYPGCACDVPSYLYSFSFAQNPRWSRLFSPQQEIWDYLRDCVERFGLAPHLEYGADVTAATWDASSGRWTVDVDGSEPISCRVLVSGVGALHLPVTPDLPGRDDYAGTVFHSAAWPADLDLTGRRVAVVGTGASAIQIVPAIVDQVEHLDVYQRTPAWLVPKPDRAIAASERRLYAAWPAAQRAVRDLVYWALEARGVGFTMSPRLQPLVARSARRQLDRQVADPELRAVLTPDYEYGCKRALLSSDFYPAVQRPNAALVTTPIERLSATGLVDADGVERPVDTVVFATGFDLSGNLARIRITGRDGAVLGHTWESEGVNAHLGIMVAGFPNLFLLLGPNTGLGHTSVVFMIESQIAFVLAALQLVDDAGAQQIDVRRDAQRRSTASVQRGLEDTVWSSGCRSWYLDERGRNVSIWPHTTMRYWWLTRRLRRRDYALTSSRGDEPPERPVPVGATVPA